MTESRDEAIRAAHEERGRLEREHTARLEKLSYSSEPHRRPLPPSRKWVFFVFLAALTLGAVVCVVIVMIR